MNPAHVDVVLVNPPITEAQRSGPIGPIIKNLYFNSPPLGIAYIAAKLEADGISVNLRDAAVEDDTMEDTLSWVGQQTPRVLGITSSTNFFCNAVELAQRVKAACPGIITVIGGPHVTANVESTMERTCFDLGCIGEGEFTMSELARALQAGAPLDDVDGLAFRRNGKLVRTTPRPLIGDLDQLPPPARHLLSLDRYVPQPNDGPYLPKTAMVSSRGCPYRCIFCDHGIYGNTYRSFSARRIVDEMQELVQRYGIRDIAFVDSLFMLNRGRVLGIVGEIERRGLEVHWTCTIRANVADRETLARMKGAGCWRVRVGVEAGNEEVLRLIRKEVELAQVEAMVKAADELGLHPKGFFMIGHIGETRERILESVRLARALPFTDITVQINTPLPGTPQWPIAEQYGQMVSRDAREFSFWQPVFVPTGMTAEELNRLHRYFYRAFYLRPITVWRHLRMLRRSSDVRRYLRAFSLLIRMFVLKRFKKRKGLNA